MTNLAATSLLAEVQVCTLTSTKRLSRALLEEYNDAQARTGRLAWPAADILPWQAWLHRSYTQLQGFEPAPLPRLLSDVQQQVVWESLIQESSSAERARLILQPRAAASLARKAQLLLDRWGLESSRIDTAGSQEAGLFKVWSRRFGQRCVEAGWISPGAIESVLMEGLVRHPQLAPTALCLRGFQHHYPQQARLLRRLEQAGTHLDYEARPPEAHAAQRISFSRAEEELSCIAGWCRRLLETGQPGPIAVVVPDLAQRLHEVEDTFADVLQPNWWREDACAAPHLRGYNISLGPALDEPRMVADGLAVLALLVGPVSVVEAGQILLSEYMAGAVRERGVRARIDARLRELAEPRWRMRSLIAQCRNRRTTQVDEGATVLVACLSRLRKHLSGPHRRPASVWAECFAQGLRLMGWPGEHTLDSAHYQLFVAFREQLQELASLDGFSAEMSGTQALGQLQRLLAGQRFQPAASPAAVHIMGVLEAAGQQFEQLWLSGMQDNQWPPVSESNPFLPLALQRREAMPGADPATELARAERLTHSLLAAAPKVLLSHVQMQADQICRVSPLIESIPELAREQLPVADFTGPVAALSKADFALEIISDKGPPALPADSRANGGSAALQDQAACPFRAVAHRRLGAKGLESVASPIDGRVRGLMAHRLVQHLWGELGDSKTLKVMAPAALAALLEQVAQQVVSEAARERPRAFAGQLQPIEARRLVRLGQDWLAVERQRQPFRVMSTEQQQILHLGGLTLNMRLDRVDQLENGELFLIDYKTGRATIGSWMNPRPEQPQLPLYCLLFDSPHDSTTPLAGLAFASLKLGAVGFVGIAARPQIAPDIKSFTDRSLKKYTDLNDLIKRWHQDLETLAQEFAAGEARVDPRDGTNTCRYCDAAAFCRISDGGTAAEPDPGAPTL